MTEAISEVVPLGELIAAVRLGSWANEFGPLIVVEGDPSLPAPPELAGLPAVVVWANPSGEPSERPPSWCDVVVSGVDELNDIAAVVSDAPIAAVTFAMLLRRQGAISVDDGLYVESATYSTLQAGPEFSAWRERRPSKRVVHTDDEPVLIDRDGDVLTITLNRPQVHNALNAAMRDQLLEALRIARVDDTVRRVILRGAGPSFCAGGDLSEFGSFVDPAQAHTLRLELSIGRVLHELADRTTAHLHGHAVGSGIELPAFCGYVTACADTTVALPEVRLGLVPGAGGTVSLPARIGRHRTAWLGLTGRSIDATTALVWGLIDQIVEAHEP